MRHLRMAALLLVLTATAAAAQEPDGFLKPPENLMVKGIPPIPESVLAAISAYSENRQAASLSWIGASREMLISTRFGPVYQIHRVSTPGGARSQLTFVPDGIAYTQPADAVASARPDGRSFVYVRDTARGRERQHLFLYDLATARTIQLTTGESRNEFPVWSRDGTLVAFTSTRRSAADRDIHVMNPDERGSSRLLAEVKGQWQVLDWSPDGTALLARQDISTNETRLWLVDAKSGAMRELKLSEAPSLTGTAAFGADAGTVYATNDAGAEFLRVVRVDTASGRVASIAITARGDVESLSVSSDGRLLAFTANEEGVGTLHVYDAAAGRERPLQGLPAGSILSARFRPGAQEIAFDVVSSRHPRDVFSIDLSTGSVSRWTRGELNGMNGDELPAAQLVRWKSFDGTSITGFLYRPPARFTGPRPVMINIHGGPAQQERPRFLGFSNYFVNELGVAIIYPNVRGSTGFGKSFLKADDGLNREAPVKDVGALLEWIGTQPDLDASRVMVTGASFGGYMTYAVATTYPDRIRCAFAGSAISNLVTDIERTAPEGQGLRRQEYGDERDPQVRAFLEKIAPLNHAAALNQPLFIAHGKNDTRVPVAQAEQMAAAVEKNGKPLWVMIVQDEGHFIGSRRPTQDFLFSAWAFFVQTFLADRAPSSTGY